VSRYPQLLATLLEDPTWTEEDIKKLAGLNVLRVFGKVEQVIEQRAKYTKFDKGRINSIREIVEKIN
jgi:hypothetical protein